MLVVLICFLPKANAVITVYDDGGTHTINSEMLEVLVRDSNLGQPTTVNVVEGGSGHKFTVEDYSVLNIMDGYIMEIAGDDNSTINVYGGHHTSLYSSSVVNIYGGYIDWWERTLGGFLNMEGGTFENILGYEIEVIVSGGIIKGVIELGFNSVAEITGGNFEYDGVAMSFGMDLFYDSTATVSGGRFSDVAYFRIMYDSILTFIGSDFEIDGQPADYGEYTGDNYSAILTGLLASGEAFSGSIYLNQNGILILEPVTIGGYIDWTDLTIFVEGWLDSNCSDANYWCYWADINRNTEVDFTDFALMADNWLESIED
jgi:hypothetical protein